MIEWKNTDLLPYQLKCEGKPWLLLDRSGPFFRLRLGFPDSEEHKAVRVRRFNFRRCKDNCNYDKLNEVAPDLLAIATVLGVTPLASIKKVKGVLPEALNRQGVWGAVGGQTSGSIPIQWATTGGNQLVWDIETVNFNWNVEEENQ